MVRPALAALALLALAAPAEAALSITEVRAPQDPLQPVAELGQVEVEIAVDCSSVFARTPPPSAPEGVRVTFDAPEHAVLTGASVQPLSSDACPTPTGNVTLVAPFQVVVLREAVGLRPLALVARAVLLGDPLIPDPAEDAAEFTITPGPFLAYQAQVDTKLKGCGCPVVFDVAVTNFGNVATTFSFELALAPIAGNVTLPEPFTLEPSTAGSTSVGTGKIVFAGPPGDWPGEVVLSVAVKGAAAADASAVGTPVSVSMLVRNEAGQAKDVPSPEPTALVLVLLALAVAAARRRP